MNEVCVSNQFCKCIHRSKEIGMIRFHYQAIPDAICGIAHDENKVRTTMRWNVEFQSTSCFSFIFPKVIDKKELIRYMGEYSLYI